jgi:hypothetical protein
MGLELSPLKTANSRRALALPIVAVESPKARRRAQLEERMRAGADWNGDADGSYLQRGCCTRRCARRPSWDADGGRAAADEVAHAAPQRREAASGRRHSAIRRGAILVHAQISTTSEIYGHPVPKLTAGAAARMGTLLKAKA